MQVLVSYMIFIKSSTKIVSNQKQDLHVFKMLKTPNNRAVIARLAEKILFSHNISLFFSFIFVAAPVRNQTS